MSQIIKILNLYSYKVPNKITNHPRSDWTHNYKKENYNNLSYQESINILLSNMEKLSKLLKKLYKYIIVQRICIP